MCEALNTAEDIRNELEKILIRARYKVLVAIRPIGPAKEAYNLIVAEFAQSLRAFSDMAAVEFSEKLKLKE